MADTYYIDLARRTLNNAILHLSNAQEYLRDAGLSIEAKDTQASINRIRRQIDRLAKLPPKEKK